MIVRPEGFVIPQGAARIHGITTETAMRSGMLLRRCLQQLVIAGDDATLLVAHNLSYDLGILNREFHRAALPNAFESVPGICTMRAATNYCRLPKVNNRTGYKYPTLDELHRRLFGYDFLNAHNAEADSEACMKCFFELCKLHVIEPPTTVPISSRPSKSEIGVPTAPLGQADNLQRRIGKATSASACDPPPHHLICRDIPFNCPHCYSSGVVQDSHIVRCPSCGRNVFIR